jgi:hypothetical protein
MKIGHFVAVLQSADGAHGIPAVHARHFDVHDDGVERFLLYGFNASSPSPARRVSMP